MKIRVKEDNIYWVELQGTDAELNAAREWVKERWDADRAVPYRNNRTINIFEPRRPRDPNQILATTIMMFHLEDVILFKLTWAG